MQLFNFCGWLFSPRTDERQLIEKAQQGSAAAFEALIKNHEQKLYSFAVTITGGNHALAGDVLQNALLQAFRNIQSFRHDCSFSSWMWKITKNEFLKYLERADGVGDLPLEDSQIAAREEDAPLPESAAIRNEQFAALRILIAQLPPEDQEIITLVDLQELEYAEVAQLLAIPLNTVRTRLHRARKKLALLVMEKRELFL